jgi:putative hemolysin
MKKIVLALAALSSLSAFAGGGSSAGVPNPAGEFCVKAAKGKIQMLSTQLGQEGFCVLGRAMIDEWTLFRFAGKSRQPQDAVEAYLRRTSLPGGGSSVGIAKIANPASVNCAKLGGQLVIAEDARGNQYGICEFADRSAIEEWTLFRSPDDSANAALTKFLMRQ